MIAALARLLVILIAAETVATVLALPIPGAVLGLLAVFALFARAGEADPETGRIFDAVAPHATLLFVPAVVGVVGNLEAVAAFWVTFLAVVTAGTAVTLVAVGLAAQLMLDRRREGARS